MHLIERLYSAEFDFAERDCEPSKQLLVASIPRSGSTIFCETLWETGVLGAPMEYLAIPNRTGLYNRLGSKDWVDYWNKVKRVRTSDSGVFTSKIFSANLVEIAKEHKDLYPLIKPTHIVFLTRDDVNRQAISFSRAVQTGAWFANAKSRRDEEYNVEQISHYVKDINNQKLFWEDVFVKIGVNVLRLTYEQFLADREGVANSVVDFLGEKPDPSKRIALPTIDVQRDEQTEQWLTKYLTEAQEPSIS